MSSSAGRGLLPRPIGTLSEVPFMQDVKRWGVLMIGTGLGNQQPQR
jgi:hypothetical protein